MSVQCLSSSAAYLSQRALFPMGQGPRLLKDCLLEDSNSCSSSGFKSFPRHPLQSCPIIPKKQSKLIHKRTLEALINTFKTLRFNAVKSAPSILPRSLSRRLSKKGGSNQTNQADITVRVKDIVHWRSSKDLLEDVPAPSDFEPSTVTTITDGSTTSGTPCSSWCDSDFTSELLPSWGGKFDEYGEKDVGKEKYEINKKDLPRVNEVSSVDATAVTVADTGVGPEEDLQCDGDSENNSPVSVLEIQYEEEDEASESSLSQCLDNVERTKQRLMQSIKRFETLAKISPFNLKEWVYSDEDSCSEGEAEAGVGYNNENYNSVDEEAGEIEVKTQQLWRQVKEGRAIWIHDEHLMMDFLRDEVMKRPDLYRDQEFEKKLVTQAKEWIRGERLCEIEHGSSEQKRKTCVREIERGEWNRKRMKEEEEEVAVEIEDGLFNQLIKEILT